MSAAGLATDFYIKRRRGDEIKCFFRFAPVLHLFVIFKRCLIAWSEKWLKDVL